MTHGKVSAIVLFAFLNIFAIACRQGPTELPDLVADNAEQLPTIEVVSKNSSSQPGLEPRLREKKTAAGRGKCINFEC